VNKDLYNKKVKVPDEIREHMRNSFSSISSESNDEGYKRNKELQDSEEITYQQLKRIKNFFDNFKGNQNEPSFILNGGVVMKNWVNNELRKMRDDIKTTKTNKMNVGMQNQFIKPHEKKNFNNVRPSQEHSGTMDNYNTSVTECLKRINEIISKI
jgi:hypothetical protein